MVHHGRKAGARSPKAIRVSKRISKRVQKNSKKEKKENAVAKCLDFGAARVSECVEPEAEPMDQQDLSGDADPAVNADPTEDETEQVYPEINAEDEDLANAEEEVPADAEEEEEAPVNEEGEHRELTEDEKIAASKQDLIEFFETSSFALAMQARLLAKKPDHELNYGCMLSTLAAG